MTDYSLRSTLVKVPTEEVVPLYVLLNIGRRLLFMEIDSVRQQLVVVNALIKDMPLLIRVNRLILRDQMQGQLVILVFNEIIRVLVISVVLVEVQRVLGP